MAEAELSVIIPACAAEQTLTRAVSSVLQSRGPRAEVIVVANDESDYRSLLDLPAEAKGRVQFARTPAPRTGPSSARNLGVKRAQAPLLAFLDADDFYEPGRLARLAPLAREHGAATGPCAPVPESAPLAALRSTEPGEVGSLSLETILSSRRSFSPVLQRELAPPWRAISFAEDMIFNVELSGRVSRYAYDPEALYGYVQTAGSASRGAGSLHRALRGYGDILSMLFELDLSDKARAQLFHQLRRDIDDAGEALFVRRQEGWGEALGGAKNDGQI